MGWFEKFAKSAQNLSNDIGEGIVDSGQSIANAASDAVDLFTAPFKLIDTIINLDSSDLMIKHPERDAYDAAINLVRGYKLPKKSVRILRITDIVFHEMSEKFDGTLSVQDALKNNANTVLDTTTYPDRAILRLYNGRGFSAYVTSITIDAIRTMQYSGEAGELLHDSLKRDDDIRRNGETVFEIGNEYIVDGTQCAKIADYWYKALGKKKHMYALSIPGSCPWYSVGDWYNLQVGEADTNEYIDAVVECFSVDVERSAGGIGSTTLILRDVEDNWAKTTLYETRIATGGSPKRRVNRSNIVTVASSEYDGTYDYKCDGTDDDVQIQAAIDYVSNTWGGGTVQLTNGAYYTSSQINMNSNIILKGAGASTIVYPDITVQSAIYSLSKTTYTISNIVIDGGDLVRITYASCYGIADIAYADNAVTIDNVEVRNLISQSGTGSSIGIQTSGIVQNCYVHDCAGDASTGFYGIYGAIRTSYNLVDNISGNAGYGYKECRKCQQNKGSNCSSASYSTSYADSGTANACADTPDGGFNS